MKWRSSWVEVEIELGVELELGKKKGPEIPHLFFDFLQFMEKKMTANLKCERVKGLTLPTIRLVIFVFTG